MCNMVMGAIWKKRHHKFYEACIIESKKVISIGLSVEKTADAADEKVKFFKYTP